MLSETNSKILTFIMFIGFIYFIQVISNYETPKYTVKYDKSTIRSSYGDEYWNYTGESDVVEDNIKEIIVEGFGPFQNTEEAISVTHSTCPVMEGRTTTMTDCIHFPNNSLVGLPGPVDAGFLISVCCEDCINKIQTSFNNNTGEYKIIYEENEFILTKNDVKKQVVLPCNSTNSNIITDNVSTHSR